MDILLTRFEKTDNYTIGKLEIPNVFMCFTCEDTQRAAGVKVKAETAIPCGRYEIIINQSPHFGRRLPLLLNVPMFEGIRIHLGNTHDHTEGCLLVGFVYDGAGKILFSKDCEPLVTTLIDKALKKGEQVFITIQ